LRSTSDVPPSIVFALARRKVVARASVRLSSGIHAVAATPLAFTAKLERRWLYSALKTLLTAPSGPGCWPRSRAELARNAVISFTWDSM